MRERLSRLATRLQALAACGALLVVFTGSPAWAQAPSAADRATARALAIEGQKALDAGNYPLALDRFVRANELVSAPTLELRIARAQVGLGRLVEAQETYNRIIREGVAPGSPDVFAEAVADARKEVADLAPRLSWVTITVRGPGTAEVAIDDTPVPAAAMGVRRAIDPGTHRIRVSADGYRPIDRELRIDEGQSERLELVLEPVSSEPGAEQPERSWQRTAGYSALAVGGVGLIVGSIAGVVAIGKHSDLSDQCPNGRCPSSSASLLDSYRTAGTVSTLGFVVAAVGAGVGVSLLVTAPDDPQRGYVGPYVGLGTLGARGRF